VQLEASRRDARGITGRDRRDQGHEEIPAQTGPRTTSRDIGIEDDASREQSGRRRPTQDEALTDGRGHGAIEAQQREYLRTRRICQSASSSDADTDLVRTHMQSQLGGIARRPWIAQRAAGQCGGPVQGDEQTVRFERGEGIVALRVTLRPGDHDLPTMDPIPVDPGEIQCQTAGLGAGIDSRVVDLDGADPCECRTGQDAYGVAGADWRATRRSGHHDAMASDREDPVDRQPHASVSPSGPGGGAIAEARQPGSKLIQTGAARPGHDDDGRTAEVRSRQARRYLGRDGESTIVADEVGARSPIARHIWAIR
jgi:hypothetical protein